MKTSRFITTACLTLTLIGSGVFLTNCKKDKKTEDPLPTPAPAPAPTPATNTEKLCGKNFKLTAWTVNPPIPLGPTSISDIYAQLEACTKDDITTFNTNGTYKDDEGASVCTPGDPQTTTGTWVWSSDEKTLTITETGSSSPQSATVVTNDGTTLKVTMSEVDGGITYMHTMTYTKQ